MKLHLHDYTPDEVRGMEAPGILSVLAWQGLGAKWEEGDDSLFLAFASGEDLAERMNGTGLLVVYKDCSIASDPGAAMKALEELGRQATADERYWIEIYSSGDEWRVGIAPQSERHDDGDPYFVEGCAPSLPLAVAYACALWGLATIEKERANG